MIGHLLFMATEMAWLAAPLVLVDAAMPTDTPVLAAVLAFPLAYLAARFLPINRDHPAVEMAWCAGLIVALIAVTASLVWANGPSGERPVPNFVFAAMVGTLAAIRGWLLARRDPDPKTFALSFQAGLMVVAATLFLVAELNVPMSTQIALALGLMLFGLSGLWHARATARDWQGGPGHPGTALLGLLAVMGLGALLWAVLDRSVLEAGLAGLEWMWGQVRSVILFLVGLLPDLTPPASTLDPSAIRNLPPAPQMPEIPREAPGGPPRALVAAILAGLAACAVMALYFFFKALARGGRAGRTRGLTYGRAKGGFLQAIRALTERIRERLRRMVAARQERRRQGSVRGRYAFLLARLGRRGWPRRAYETPQEYLRRLAPQWPDGEADFAALTRAFVDARYGGHEPDPARVEELWHRLNAGTGRLRKAND